MRLADQDRHAIDLILDHGAASVTDAGGAFVAPPTGDEMRQRVAGIDTILAVLGTMPAQEPSPDLVARTMRRIDQRAADPDADQITVPSLFDGDRPLA